MTVTPRARARRQGSLAGPRGLSQETGLTTTAVP
jgi:hypothetical protein